MRTLNRRLVALLPAALLTAVAFVAPLSHAQSDTDPALDRAQLKEEIVREVITELRDSGVLQEAVQQGIQDFIQSQQEAQAAAREQQQRRADERAGNVRPVSTDRDHIYGNPDAPISLIEYSDFECPYCKRFHPTAKELVDQSDGGVNLVYRHFPLDFHNPGAQTQAEASECAAELGGNDAFWAFTDAIYERTRSGGKGFPRNRIVPLAVEIGLDEAAFEDCLESGRHADRVKSDMAEGVQAGVSGTPGNILLNNETGEAVMRAGAQPLGALQEAVNNLTDGGDPSS